MKRAPVLAVVVAVVATALVLNVAGIARYPGGPLREWRDGGVLWLDLWPSDWGNNAEANAPEADWAAPSAPLLYTSDLAPDDWPWPVEVERITPVDGAGNLIVSEALLVRPGTTRPSDLWAFGPLTADQRALLDATFAPLPGSVAPDGDAHLIVLAVHGLEKGPAGWETLAVDYRVGPFSFRAIHHDALHLCLGSTPAERTCLGQP